MVPERDSYRRADWGLTGMARPKEFDPEEALAKAIAVFTAYGYGGHLHRNPSQGHADQSPEHV